MLSNPLRSLKSRLQRATQWKPKARKLDNLVRIGTNYGGWIIPANLLTDRSICYLAGAGEDISFDVGLVERYGCQAFIYDPTPRAKQHFDLLVASVRENRKMPIDRSATEFYALAPENVGLLHFRELGLWNKRDQLRFYAPRNPEHVSHSALNLQGTTDHFTAQVDRLSEIMKQEGHEHLDLLKIDIEGAEYAVIDSLIEDKLRVKVLCVEYDEAHNPLDADFRKRIRESVRRLTRYGYKIVDVDAHFNFTFVTKDVFRELSAKNKGRK